MISNKYTKIVTLYILSYEWMLTRVLCCYINECYFTRGKFRISGSRGRHSVFICMAYKICVNKYFVQVRLQTKTNDDLPLTLHFYFHSVVFFCYCQWRIDNIYMLYTYPFKSCVRLSSEGLSPPFRLPGFFCFPHSQYTPCVFTI